MSDLNIFHGPNAGYVLDLYERYQQDPASVDPQTRAFFEAWTPPEIEQPAAPETAAQAPAIDVLKIVGAARLARLTREYGHLAARLDPLGGEPPGDPELQLETHGLTEQDLTLLPATVVGGPLAEGAANALEAMARLRAAYSGSIGYEDDHVKEPAEREWIREAAESGRFLQAFDAERKRELLERLTEVETFERYLQQAFLG